MLQQNNMASPPNPPEQGSPEQELGNATTRKVNFPYRGYELHGVDQPNQIQPVGGDEYAHNATRTGPESPYEDEHQQDPVPVVVVNEALRQLRRWRVGRELATGTPRRIVGRQDGRLVLRVKNIMPATTAWVGDSSGSCTQNFGYILPPGVELTFNHEDEVWATSEGGDASPVALVIYYEFASAI